MTNNRVKFRLRNHAYGDPLMGWIDFHFLYRCERKETVSNLQWRAKSQRLLDDKSSRCKSYQISYLAFSKQEKIFFSFFERHEGTMTGWTLLTSYLIYSIFQMGSFYDLTRIVSIFFFFSCIKSTLPIFIGSDLWLVIAKCIKSKIFLALTALFELFVQKIKKERKQLFCSAFFITI